MLGSRGAFGNGPDRRLLCARGGGSDAGTKGCCAPAKADRAVNGPGRVACHENGLKLGLGERLNVAWRGV